MGENKDGTTLTVLGRQLLTKLSVGQGPLRITRAAIGTGKLEGDPALLEGLVGYEMDAMVAGYGVDGGSHEAYVTIQVSNADVVQGFYMTEIGIYAQDPDDGEVLYAYVGLSDDPNYIMPPETGRSKLVQFKVHMIVGDAAGVTATINPLSQVTREEYDAGMAKKADLDGGDASDMVSDAMEPESQEDRYPGISPESPVKQIFGYLYRWVKSLKADKISVSDLVDNCTSTATDKAPTARQAKVLWDKIVDAVAALATHKSSADHDGRYYTESEINTKLDGKSNTNHGHSGMLVTGDVIDNCTSTATNKPLSAKQGKTLWDKIANAVSALATHKSSADHDGRYYTESEINTKLGGKSDTSHNHDGSYVKKNSTAEVGGIMVGNKATDGYGWMDIYYKGAHAFSIYAESIYKLVIKPVNVIHNGNTYDIDIQGTLKERGVHVVIGSQIVNNCTSADPTKVLSAEQGKVLMDKCNQLNSDLHDNLASVVFWKRYNISVGVLKPGVNRYDQKTTISLPSGYTSAAIAGFGLAGFGYTSCVITKLQVIGSEVTWSVENKGTSDTGSLTLEIDVMHFKSK